MDDYVVLWNHSRATVLTKIGEVPPGKSIRVRVSDAHRYTISGHLKYEPIEPKPAQAAAKAREPERPQPAPEEVSQTPRRRKPKAPPKES